MAARKFLARPASSSSVDIDFDDDPNVGGAGAPSNNSSASADQLSARRLGGESKEDYDLSSFSFENLNRLSEMNLEAAARAQDPDRQ